MKFQIGKYYQHGTGRVICIIGTAHTFFHGSCLLAEEDTGTLIPVGSDEESAQNWHQVSGWGRSCYAGNNIPDPIESCAHHYAATGVNTGRCIKCDDVMSFESNVNPQPPL